MIDPKRPLTSAEQITFGAKARRHPITGLPLEDGIGAAPIERQALLHCDVIEQQSGNAAADVMRRRLAEAKQLVAAEVAAAADGVTLAAAEAAAESPLE